MKNPPGRANSANRDAGANAIGGAEMARWRVTGELSGSPVTMRFRALSKDEAMKQAHDRGIRIETCVQMKQADTNTPANT